MDWKPYLEGKKSMLCFVQSLHRFLLDFINYFGNSKLVVIAHVKPFLYLRRNEYESGGGGGARVVDPPPPPPINPKFAQVSQLKEKSKMKSQHNFKTNCWLRSRHQTWLGPAWLLGQAEGCQAFESLCRQRSLCVNFSRLSSRYRQYRFDIISITA